MVDKVLSRVPLHDEEWYNGADGEQERFAEHDPICCWAKPTGLLDSVERVDRLLTVEPFKQYKRCPHAVHNEWL